MATHCSYLFNRYSRRHCCDNLSIEKPIPVCATYTISRLGSTCVCVCHCIYAPFHMFVCAIMCVCDNNLLVAWVAKCLILLHCLPCVVGTLYSVCMYKIKRVYSMCVYVHNSPSVGGARPVGVPDRAAPWTGIDCST